MTNGLTSGKTKVSWYQMDERKYKTGKKKSTLIKL